MYCILTKYTVADQMLKFGGGHIFLGGFTAAGDKKSANPDRGLFDGGEEVYLKFFTAVLLGCVASRPADPQC